MSKLKFIVSAFTLSLFAAACGSKTTNANTQDSKESDSQSKEEVKLKDLVKDEVVRKVQMMTPSNETLFALRNKDSNMECWYSAPLNKVDKIFQIRKYTIDATNVTRLNAQELPAQDVSAGFSREYYEAARSAHAMTNVWGMGMIAGATATVIPLGLAALGTVMTFGAGIVLFIPAGLISAAGAAATVFSAANLFIFNPLAEDRANSAKTMNNKLTELIRSYNPGSELNYNRISKYIFDRNVAVLQQLSESTDVSKGQECSPSPFSQTEVQE